jgi:transposase
MTKTVSTSKKPRKQHSPEFRSEALKLAERIGVTAAARELSLYESQLYNWRSKQQNQQTSSERELEMSTEIARLKRQLAERRANAAGRLLVITVIFLAVINPSAISIVVLPLSRITV